MCSDQDRGIGKAYGKRVKNMEKMLTVVQENTIRALEDTRKKIDGLKNFHIPIAQNVIEEYEKAEVDGYFMEQQKYQLQKLLNMLAELEAKDERLQQRL
jgi:hypothetical protein